ncbi:MAG: alpha/beta hydrolase [Gammaproteobacteria bacterium]
MYSRVSTEFRSDGNLVLRGWFYSPNDRKSKLPCIILTHGFSALKEHYLDKYAQEFVANGMCVLVYDNRNFGTSDGFPRLEVDPIAQIRDLRNAISFVQGLDSVDPDQIGLWGTSFSGGTSIVASANDKRVKCVVAQVPFISGHHKSIRLARPEQWEEIRKKYDEDRTARLLGNDPQMIKVVSDSSGNGIMRTPSAFSFFASIQTWENKVTLRSVENSGDFEPIAYIKYISPTPILFIVAKNDTVNATDLALRAYKKALKPKKLVLIDGDHFDPYFDQFEISAKKACEWFVKHLKVKPFTHGEALESQPSLPRAKL